jgi:hypothetical protein
MLFSVKEINRNDLVIRVPHFNWGKLSAVLREKFDPPSSSDTPLSSLCLDGNEVG